MVRKNYTISEAAEQVGLGPWTLRRLERQGRIPAARRDPLARARVYSEDDLTTLKAVLASLTADPACAVVAS